MKKLARFFGTETKILLAIAIISFGFRVPLLSGSFWLDEAAQALESARPLSQQLQIVDDFQPPLIHLLTHLSLKFGRAEWWLRTPAALLPGIISIVGMYKLTLLLMGRRNALWMSGLLATSSLHIFYSQELRPYALPMALAVLSWWCLVKHSQEPAARLKWWFAGLSILGLYASYLYPFLLISQAIYILWSFRKTWTSWIGVAVSIVAAYLPWLPYFLEQLQAGGQVRQDLPGWSEVVSIPQLKALPLVVAKFVFGVMNIEFSAFYVGVGLIIACLLAMSAWQWWQHRTDARSLTIIWMWFFVPLLTSWVVSFWVPVVQPKRVLYLLPVFYLGVLYLSEQWKSKPQRWFLPVCILFINLVSTFQYWTQPMYQREDWRGLHREIIQKYSSDTTVVLFSFPEPFAPWRWYDDGTYPTFSTGALSVAAIPDLPDKLKPISTAKYVLVFDYLRDLTDPEDQILHVVQNLGYKGVAVLDRPNIGFVRVYAQPAEVVGQR